MESSAASRVSAANSKGKKTKYRKGDKVWVKDTEKCYVSGIFQGQMGLNAFIELDNHETSRYPISRLKKRGTLPFADRKRGYVSNVLSLPIINDAGVLNNLESIVRHDRVFCYSGELLLAMKPQKMIPKMFDEGAVERYRTLKSEAELKSNPHVFAIAEKALRKLKTTRRNQSIVLTGETGSGKTENARTIVSYIGCSASTENASAALSTDWRRIFAAGALLESFTNAATVRNFNSSRAVLQTEMFFAEDTTSQARIAEGAADGDGVHAGLIMAGCEISLFGLEVTRIVQRDQGDRSFHIFYQMLSGLDSESLLQLALVQDFQKYSFLAVPERAEALKQGPRSEKATLRSRQITENQKDSLAFAGVRHAMETVGFSPEEVADVIRLLAAIIHLGNIRFVETKPSKSNPAAGVDVAKKDVAALTNAASCLGISAEELKSALTSRSVSLGRSFSVVPVPFAQVVQFRDFIARTLYVRIVEHLIERINVFLKVDPGGSRGAPSVSEVDTSSGSQDQGGSLVKKDEGNGSGKSLIDSVLQHSGATDRGRRATPAASNVLGSISVIDVPGFEDSPPNIFNDLAINYVNDCFQNYFNKHVFESEKRACRMENLNDIADGVHYTSSANSVNFFQKENSGFVAQLATECLDPRGSDTAFLIRLSNLHRTSSVFRAVIAPDAKPQFVVDHYFGAVEYNPVGMKDLDRIHLDPHTVDSFQKSSLTLLKEMYSEVIGSVADTGNPNIQPLQRGRTAPRMDAGTSAPLVAAEEPGAGGGAGEGGDTVSGLASAGGRRPYRRKRRSSISMTTAAQATTAETTMGQLQTALAATLKHLSQSGVHFVRCIRTTAQVELLTEDVPEEPEPSKAKAGSRTKAASAAAAEETSSTPPPKFDRFHVLHQLEYSNILEAALLHVEGFTTHILCKNFLKRFHLLANLCRPDPVPGFVRASQLAPAEQKEADKALVSKILQKYLDDPVNNFRMGKSRVFLKLGQTTILDHTQFRKKTNAIMALWRYMNGWQKRKRFERMKHAASVIQESFRKSQLRRRWFCYFEALRCRCEKVDMAFADSESLFWNQLERDEALQVPQERLLMAQEDARGYNLRVETVAAIKLQQQQHTLRAQAEDALRMQKQVTAKTARTAQKERRAMMQADASSAVMNKAMGDVLLRFRLKQAIERNLRDNPYARSLMASFGKTLLSAAQASASDMDAYSAMAVERLRKLAEANRSAIVAEVVGQKDRDSIPIVSQFCVSKQESRHAVRAFLRRAQRLRRFGEASRKQGRFVERRKQLRKQMEIRNMEKELAEILAHSSTLATSVSAPRVEESVVMLQSMHILKSEASLMDFLCRIAPEAYLPKNFLNREFPEQEADSESALPSIEISDPAGAKGASGVSPGGHRLGEQQSNSDDDYDFFEGGVVKKCSTLAEKKKALSKFKVVRRLLLQFDHANNSNLHAQSVQSAYSSTLASQGMTAERQIRLAQAGAAQARVASAYLKAKLAGLGLGGGGGGGVLADARARAVVDPALLKLLDEPGGAAEATAAPVQGRGQRAEYGVGQEAPFAVGRDNERGGSLRDLASLHGRRQPLGSSDFPNGKLGSQMEVSSQARPEKLVSDVQSIGEDLLYFFENPDSAADTTTAGEISEMEVTERPGLDSRGLLSAAGAPAGGGSRLARRTRTLQQQQRERVLKSELRRRENGQLDAIKDYIQKQRSAKAMKVAAKIWSKERRQMGLKRFGELNETILNDQLGAILERTKHLAEQRELSVEQRNFTREQGSQYISGRIDSVENGFVK